MFLISAKKSFFEFSKKEEERNRLCIHKESHWDVIVENVWVALCRSFNYKLFTFMYLMFLCLSSQCLLLTLKFSFILNMMKLMLYCKSILPSSTKSFVKKNSAIQYRQGKIRDGLINVVSNENIKKTWSLCVLVNLI